MPEKEYATRFWGFVGSESPFVNKVVYLLQCKPRKPGCIFGSYVFVLWHKLKAND